MLTVSRWTEQILAPYLSQLQIMVAAAAKHTVVAAYVGCSAVDKDDRLAGCHGPHGISQNYISGGDVVQRNMQAAVTQQVLVAKHCTLVAVLAVEIPSQLSRVAATAFAPAASEKFRRSRVSRSSELLAKLLRSQAVCFVKALPG